MVAYETLHTMINKLKGRNWSITVKFDMSKTYDSVEWSNLEAIMRKLGFKERWIKLIITCMKFISYSYLVNGKLGEIIIHSRGLW